MTLWIILTVMTASAAVLVAAPFLRRQGIRNASANTQIEVFRDQLREVDREAEQRLIDQDQADAARAEIRRRVLAVDKAVPSPISQPPYSSPNMAVVGIAGIVVLGSVALYAVNGRPDLPSGPAMSDAGNPRGILAALHAQGQQQSADHNSNATQSGLATVEEMVDRLRLRLAAQPNDPEGWRMLGWSLFSTERYPEAVEAYAKAVALDPGFAGLQSSYGEAIVRSSSGVVTPLASGVFDKALAADAKDPRARFFKGLAVEQSGDKNAALDAWIAILKDASPGEGWVSDLEQRVAELAREIGTEITGRLAQRKGPTAADIRDAAGLPADQQTAMIRGMVDGLASRLAVSPRDEEGWIKLIRSYSVLGEAESAKKALQRALQAFDEATPERLRIAAIASGLGILP